MYGVRVFMGPNNRIVSDNDTQTGMMLDRVLAMVCRNWYRRFRAPLCHYGLVTRSMMQSALQSVIRRSHRPTVLKEDTVKPAGIVDDWDKMVSSDTMQVLTDDDEDGDEALYDGPNVRVELRPLSGRRTRNMHEFRVGPCVFFPSPHIPIQAAMHHTHCGLATDPIVSITARTSSSKENPIDWARPSTTDEAESLMITENFWESVEMKQTIERNRIPRFEPGYSRVGRFQAVVTETAAAPESEAGPSPLAFYLGPQTRLGPGHLAWACNGLLTNGSPRPLCRVGGCLPCLSTWMTIAPGRSWWSTTTLVRKQSHFYSSGTARAHHPGGSHNPFPRRRIGTATLATE